MVGAEPISAELLRRWARLGNEIRILKVYEKLGPVTTPAPVEEGHS